MIRLTRGWFCSARAAPLEAGAVVTLRETRSMFHSSLLRSPAGAHRRSQSRRPASTTSKRSRISCGESTASRAKDAAVRASRHPRPLPCPAAAMSSSEDVASLDQAVGYDDQVNKPDSDCRQVQEGLLWSRDWQTLAKRGLCRLVAVVRANSLANQAPKGRRQVTWVAPSAGGAAPHNSAAV